jgi:hypothetical protein
MRAALVIFLLFPAICSAEVMDKMPSLLSISITMVVGVIASYLSARFNPTLLFIVLPVLGLLTLSGLFEADDPYIAAAIAQEASKTYIFVSWLSPFIILIFACLGLFIRSRHVKANT